MNWNDIPGWFHAQYLYDHIACMCPRNSILVEIGAYMGRSACFMGSALKKYDRKDVRFYTVDHFRGSPEHQENLKGKDLKQICHNNIVDCGLSKWVRTICMESTAAAQKFADLSVYLIFIDGAHDFKSVLNDLIYWHSKLIPNGIIAGDDIRFPGVRRVINRFLPEYIQYKDIWIYSKDERMKQCLDTL